MRRSFVLFTSLTLLFAACSSPEQKAQKLFEQGKFDEVLAKYPTLPIAKPAADSAVLRLLASGRYEEVISRFPSSPFLFRAKVGVAESLLVFDQIEAFDSSFFGTSVYDSMISRELDGTIYRRLKAYVDSHFPSGYDEVIGSRNSPARFRIRNAIADRLYAMGDFEKVIRDYPNTPAGMRARNEVAAVEWTKISKLRGQRRAAAIVEFLKNPRFAGTESAIKAQQEQNKLSK